MPTRSPFSDVPRNARGHLGLLFYEAALAVIAYGARAAQRAGDRTDLRDVPIAPGLCRRAATPMPDEIEWASGGAARSASTNGKPAR